MEEVGKGVIRSNRIIIIIIIYCYGFHSYSYSYLRSCYSYKQRAFGHDDLKPVTGSFSDSWGGVGMTLVDSLDTLYLLGMHEEFNEACDWISSNLKVDSSESISVFEYNIRLLGGLLGAYDMSKREELLEKAKEVADVLKLAFEGDYPIPYVCVL